MELAVCPSIRVSASTTSHFYSQPLQASQQLCGPRVPHRASIL
jgi:hypothetical protein